MSKKSTFFAYFLATSFTLQGVALPSPDQCNGEECPESKKPTLDPFHLLPLTAGIGVIHYLSHDIAALNQGNYFDRLKQIGKVTTELALLTGTLALLETNRDSLPSGINESVDCALLGMAGRIAYPILTKLLGWNKK